MTSVALIAAAGESRRMGFDKTRRTLAGIPLLVHTIRRLLDCNVFSEMIIAVQPGAEKDMRDGILVPHKLGDCVRVVAGGETRVHSVWHALKAVRSTPDLVAIHDGARPFVSVEAVRVSLDAATQFGGAVVATRVIPTIKVADAHGCVVDTPDRANLWAAATPQSFRFADFLAAYQQLWASGADPAAFTDDARIFEHAGGRVKIVEGNVENIKVTTPFDWRVAEMLAVSH